MTVEIIHAIDARKRVESSVEKQKEKEELFVKKAIEDAIEREETVAHLKRLQHATTRFLLEDLGYVVYDTNEETVISW